MRPLLEWGEPWVKIVQPMPYVAVQQLIDGGHPWGISEYSKIDYLRELPDDAIDAIARECRQAGSPFTEVILVPPRRRVSRMDRVAWRSTSPTSRGSTSAWRCGGTRTKRTNTSPGRARFMKALRPWSVDTAPPNFIDPDEGPARLRASYGEEKFPRLVALKDKYDPDNVFALNQNIPPSVTRPPATGPESKGDHHTAAQRPDRPVTPRSLNRWSNQNNPST